MKNFYSNYFYFMLHQIDKLKMILILNEMSFEEFKLKLDEYANNNPYPNIDN